MQWGRCGRWQFGTAIIPNQVYQLSTLPLRCKFAWIHLKSFHQEWQTLHYDAPWMFSSLSCRKRMQFICYSHSSFYEPFPQLRDFLCFSFLILAQAPKQFINQKFCSWSDLQTSHHLRNKTVDFNLWVSHWRILFTFYLFCNTWLAVKVSRESRKFMFVFSTVMLLTIRCTPKNSTSGF